MSPQLSSPSLLLTLSGKSPSTPVFPFSLQDSASQRISPSRKRGTPGSEGSRSSSKLKLPKITIKRKPDGEGEYEIDKEKSNLDDLVPMLMQKSESNPMQLSFDYPQFSSAPSIPGPFSNEATVGQTDIDGLLDASSIMGGTLSQELGIPSTPFSQQLDVLGIAGMFISLMLKCSRKHLISSESSASIFCHLIKFRYLVQKASVKIMLLLLCLW